MTTSMSITGITTIVLIGYSKPKNKKEKVMIKIEIVFFFEFIKFRKKLKPASIKIWERMRCGASASERKVFDSGIERSDDVGRIVCTNTPSPEARSTKV